MHPDIIEVGPVAVVIEDSDAWLLKRGRSPDDHWPQRSPPNPRYDHALSIQRQFQPEESARLR
jgi:hypothetical protein